MNQSLAHFCKELDLSEHKRLKKIRGIPSHYVAKNKGEKKRHSSETFFLKRNHSDSIKRKNTCKNPVGIRNKLI